MVDKLPTSTEPKWRLERKYVLCIFIRTLTGLILDGPPFSQRLSINDGTIKLPIEPLGFKSVEIVARRHMDSVPFRKVKRILWNVCISNVYFIS
jgi:hypothetical protein